MNRLKWVLKDCNIYIALLFITVSFFSNISNYQPIVLCFAAIHIIKIIKMLKDKIFLISNFDVMMAISCFIPLFIDYHVDSYTFSLFLIISISLKSLLFTKISKLHFNHYIQQHHLNPDFTVIVKNDLKDYLFAGHKLTLSHYLYLNDIEIRLTDTFKGVYFQDNYIHFSVVQAYCKENGLEYVQLKKIDFINILNKTI